MNASIWNDRLEESIAFSLDMLFAEMKGHLFFVVPALLYKGLEYFGLKKEVN